ncbi:MAG: 4'-phosphopantetheinyl transferase superfamily protein [Pseudomonadota bacterium]
MTESFSLTNQSRSLLAWQATDQGEYSAFSSTIGSGDSRPLPLQGRLSLAPDQIQVHLLRPTAHATYPSLSPDEQARAQRYKFAKDRTLYRAAHHFLRTTLSRYAGIAPAAWYYSHNQYGKPAVANAGQTQLQFNLSHTRGLIGCAISLNRDVGVDVESVRPLSDLVSISRSVYVGPELDDVLSHSGDAQRTRFYTYWTLKEAYIKARGMGLYLPLEQFHFTAASDGLWQLHCAPELNDSGKHWHCQNLILSQDDYLAYIVSSHTVSTP